MKFQRYFKSGQQLLLRVLNKTRQDGRTELISASVVASESDTLILTLPYGEDAENQYPFEAGHEFEITTDALGLGVRAKGRFFKKIGTSRFALKLDPELEMFQRRISQRYDCSLGIRFSRAAKTLRTMRGIWEKNIEVLSSPEAPLVFDGFRKTRVNISSGGIRLTIKPPANQGELCLILIALDDGKPPVCTIAEIVWTCMQDETAMTAGMRFINILCDDQQRIEDFINNQKPNKVS